MNKQNEIKILIVDDDINWRGVMSESLKRWGYIVVLAVGFGKKLEDDARKKAQEHGCHIALIDMDLRDRQGQDKSGLKLIPELKPATAIVVTGYPAWDVTHEAYNQYGAFGFIGKDASPNALRKMIGDAIDKHWWFVLSSKKEVVGWPPNIDSEKLTNQFLEKMPFIKETEIEDCLQKHFEDAIKINLEYRDSSNPSDSLTLAPRGFSAIFKATVIDQRKNGNKIQRQTTLIKIARRQRIQKEKSNYREYIDGQLDIKHVANLREPTTLMWNIGIVEYAFLNDSGTISTNAGMPTFAEWYLQATVTNIKRTLERLFRIWQRFYRETKEQEVSLFEAYSMTWQSDTNNHLVKKLTSFSERRRNIDFPNFSLTLLNPIAWILRRVNRKENRDDSPQSYSSKLAVTHGDLHADNILVNRHGEPILIDFERTGVGPILQDFVLLEADVLLRVVDGLPNETFLGLVTSILNTKEIEDNCFPYNPNSKDLYEKTWHFVKEIRKLAAQYTEDNFTNYLWGLLLNVAFRSTLLEKQLENDVNKDKLNRINQEKERALLFGSLLCYRLQSSEGDWLPPLVLNRLMRKKINQLDITIPVNLHQKMRNVLEQCGELETDNKLKAIFIDERINLWQNKLPALPDRESRIDAIIMLLYRKFTRKNENGLFLFLQVLSERHDPNDTCHENLRGLAEAWAQECGRFGVEG